MNYEMFPNIKDEFPDLYTKRGVLRKVKPKRYDCSCCNFQLKTKTTRFPGIVFASYTCENCGDKAKETTAYRIWERMSQGRIEQEDFILKTIIQSGSILKGELQELIRVHFDDERCEALGFLVYYGYLRVDKILRDECNIIEYTINPNKELSKRYEKVV